MKIPTDFTIRHQLNKVEVQTAMQKCVMLRTSLGASVFLAVHRKCDSGTIRKVDMGGGRNDRYLYDIDGFIYQALRVAPNVGAEMKRLERCAFDE